MNFIQAPALLEAELREKEGRVRQYLAERGCRNNRIVSTEEAGAATLVYAPPAGTSPLPTSCMLP